VISRLECRWSRGQVDCALDQYDTSGGDGEGLPFPPRKIVSIAATRQGFPSARYRAALTAPGRDAKPSFRTRGNGGHCNW